MTKAIGASDHDGFLVDLPDPPLRVRKGQHGFEHGDDSQSQRVH